jgi:hypothetical protein
VIAEVKSTFGPTEADRLRLGLGLGYRHRYPRVDALLVVTDVDDPVWFDICAAAGVRLLAANRTDEWALTA